MNNKPLFKVHELLSIINPDREEYQKIAQSTKFYLGDMDRVTDLFLISKMDFFEIPDQVCLFQVEDEDDLYFFMATDAFDGTIWNCFSKKRDHNFVWRVEDFELFISKDGKTICTQRLSENKIFGKIQYGDEVVDNFNEMTDEEKELYYQYMTVAGSIEVLSCSNVMTVDHAPPKFINSKRLNKHEIHFFSYKTLHIHQPRKEYPSEGKATHASPRLHLRRGHIRKLADGRRIWVTSCVVGDPSKGISIHDYSVQ